MILRKKKYAKFLILIIGAAVLIPLSVYAICKCEIKIESNITIYPSTLSATDCDNNALYTTVPSTLKGLAKIMAQEAYLDNGKSEYVSSCSGVSFSDISSDTNGKGVYEIASTKDDEYPIYYYRGAVTNNNVKFADFCWKAIRTTDTGGVKLIYNGEPDSDGYCNTTGTDTQIGTSAFNSSRKSPAYVGYMYGTVYTYSSRSSSNLTTAYVYGNDVTYSSGTYTLTDTMTSTGTWSSDYNTLNNNHYTCFSTSDSCTSVYYIYFTDTSNGAYYITLTGGKTVEDALDEMFTNTTNSTAKTNIDSWYNTNLSSYTSYLEDTVYCNDRSISSLGGWNPDGGSTTSSTSFLDFSPYNRSWSTYTPTLECSRTLDKFTVSSSTGNGALTYPVGLITSDEVMYAGGAGTTTNNTYYLYTNHDYWAFSPSSFQVSSPFAYFYSYGYVSGYNVFNTVGLRPVVSLDTSSTSVSSGDGTSTNPYVIETN